MRMSRILQQVERASHKWNKLLAFVSSLFIVITVLLIAIDVSGRYMFNSPVDGAIELESTLLAYMAFLGFAYALIKEAHVRMTLMFDRFSTPARKGAEVLAGLLGLFVFSVMTYGGFVQFWESWLVQEKISEIVWIPFWPAKLAMPIGTLAMTIQFVIYILHHLNLTKNAETE